MAQGNLAITAPSAAHSSSERLADLPPIQRHHPLRGEREVGVRVMRTLGQEAVTAVEHGGDEETIADRANLACGVLFKQRLMATCSLSCLCTPRHRNP
jgi:hypothetical protein